MGIRVAYGQKNKISQAIKNEKIPKGTIIITNDKNDAETLFYSPFAHLHLSQNF